MKLLLSECPEGHQAFIFSESSEALDLASLIACKGSVAVDLDAERRGEQVVLRGMARVLLAGACARCAKAVEQALEGEILAFADRRGADKPEDEAALEQDGSILYHDGLEVALTDLVREAILLAEPAQLLCQADCKGLCSRCGSDLNDGPCGCPPNNLDPRWEALNKIKPSDG